MTGFYKEYDDTSGAYVSSAEDAAAAALVSKNAAAASATAAAASELSAGDQATAASLSETNAGTSATNAATSATNAATSETNAAGSATAAAGSATSASTDAGTATTKASEASTSATNAATSETNAASSATNAATSETNAATSATNAASSATTASTQATNAASSATAAATSETNAGNSATAAATSETNAASSATSASGSATTATTKAGEAATSATNAATSETNAATSATNSANSATSAGTAQTAAEAARDAALAAFDSFDDRYLGVHSSDPTTDNDGDALAAGMLYFNDTSDEMKVYEGSSWVAAYASLSGALLATNNLSDLNNAATARTNLGLGTAATTAASDYATAAQGTKVDGIEAGADVTDTANVTAAGALMDSELTSIASVKALDQGVATTDSPTFDDGTFTGILSITPTSGYGHIEVGGVDGAFIDLKSPSSDDYDLRMITTGGNGGTIDVGSTGDLSFNAGGSERVRLLSTGLMGIGTASPSKTLTVGGTGLRVQSTASADFYSTAQDALIVNNGNANLRLWNNGAERMRIDSTGKVGIGITSPSAKLDVDGQGCFKKNYSFASTNYHIKLKSAYGNGISSYIGNVSSSDRMNISAGGYYYGSSFYQLTDGATGMGAINIGEDGTLTYQSTTGATANSTVNPAERMRIDSSGTLTVTGNVDCNYLRADRIYSNNDGSTGYFFNDSGTRTAYGDGDFYIQSSVSNCYLYATNTYLGAGSGDVIHTRGNQVGGNGFQFSPNGDFYVNARYGSNQLAYGVRAWGRFEMIGTHSFLDDEGFSSVTDIGTGRSRLNFTNTMPNTYYSVNVTTGSTSYTSGVCSASVYSLSSTQFYVSVEDLDGGFTDRDQMNVMVVR